MKKPVTAVIREIFTFRWKPSWDLLAVAVSYLLVVGTLYIATAVVTPEAGGGVSASSSISWEYLFFRRNPPGSTTKLRKRWKT